MNEILFKMALGALIQSVKNPDKKAKLKSLLRSAVQTIVLAYADDPNFLNEEDQ